MTEVTMNMKTRYVYRQRRKDGSWGYRFERPGFQKKWMKTAPRTPEFFAEWVGLMRGEVVAPAPRDVPHGSISWLVNQYQNPENFAWSKLAPATQKQRRYFYKQITDQSPDVPAVALTADDVARWRDERAATPGAANNFIKALSALYEWGVAKKKVPENPCKGVERLPMNKDGFEPWTEDDLVRFRATWAPGTKPYLAMCLLLFTACRRSDLVLLGRQNIEGRWIVFRQTKGGEKVEIPMLPQLVEAVRGSTNMTFIVTEYGKPFTVNGFGGWFRDKCNRAGVSKRAHGLRKAAGGLLAEMGCTPHEIMAILGHSDERTSSIYTKSAKRRALAESGMKKLAGLKW